MQLTWPWQDRNGRFSVLKATIFALLFYPAGWLIFRYVTGRFGPLPLAGLTYWSGVWATATILLALAVTPVMTILRWNRLAVVRRMIGVAGFVYTIVHMFIYFALRFWDFASIGFEMVTRISLIIATISTLGLAVLTATSLDTAVRRMGSEGWQKLHNTVYAISTLAVIHFLLSPDVYEMQYLMSGILFWLMIWRVLNRRGQGANAAALSLLAVVSCLFTAGFQVVWMWIYQDYEPAYTFGTNFDLDLGVSPAWEVLILGMAIALASFGRQVFPARSLDARNTG